MITPKTRHRFLLLLQELGIPSDYPSLICVYILLSHIISKFQNIENIRINTLTFSEELKKPLRIYYKYPMASMLATKLVSAKAVELYYIMRDHGLNKDYIGFFSAFAPGMVANWYTLRKLNSSDLPILGVLYWHFTITAGITDSEAIFEKCSNDFYDEMQQHFPPLQTDEYELIWNAVNYHICAEPDMHSSRIAKAIQLYAATGKSKRDLLEGYLLEQRDLGKKPICYANLSEHERKKIAIQKIPSDDDVNFYTAATYATSELADKALANLYDYSKDIPFGESVVGFESYISRLHMAKAPLIINPNPHILNSWRELSQDDSTLPLMSVAVPNRKFALALSRRYPQVMFYSFDELIAEPLTADFVLLYGTDNREEKDVNSLLGCFCPTEHCELIACVNIRAITARTSNFFPNLAKKSLQISHIINIPSAKGAKGRLKKRSTTCVFAGYNPVVDGQAQIALFSCLTTETRDYISVLPDPIYIPLSRFNSDRTLPQLLTEQAGADVKSVASRKHATPIYWSQEIIVRYSIFNASTDKETYVRGKAYIQQMDDSEHSKYHKAIPNTQSERGLRAKNEESLLEKLATFPLREELYQPVLDEIIRVYGNCPERLTIKSVWFCLRPLLLKKGYYDDDLARKLFCGENQSLSNLTFLNPYEEYCEALKAIWGTNAISMRHWTLLWQIATEGIKHGFLDKNPFATFVPAIEADTREKIYPVQDALRKWCFDHSEMSRMVQPLLERLPSGNACYEVDSHALLKLCALFSFMRKAELCALTFGDVELLPNGGAQVAVTKFIDEAGNIREYSQREKHRRRRRKSAWPPFLTECFKRRRQYLQKKFSWSITDTQDIPLFFEKEPLSKATKVKHCSLQTATHLFKELQVLADIPVEVIQLLDGEDARDVNFGPSRKTENTYINSTRILSSFYGLEDGEVSYNAGTEPETTIDSHYVGYYAPQNQIRTSAKMHRMSAKFLRHITPSASATPQRYTLKINNIAYHKVIEPPVDKCIHTALELVPASGTFANPITIRIQSRFGHRTHVTIFGGEKHD